MRRVERESKRKAMVEVADAALMWWLSRRPIAFNAYMHMTNPTVNTTTTREAKLAKAVAKLAAMLG